VRQVRPVAARPGGVGAVSGGPGPFEPRHDWLLPGDQSDSDPADVVEDLRAGIESLPETRAVFSVNDALDNHYHTTVDDRMVLLCGAWPKPERFGPPGDNDWVNPDYVHLRRATDCYGECGCGAGVARRFGGSDGGHADHCKLSDRFEASAEMIRKRAEALKTAAELGLPGTAAARRWGMLSANSSGAQSSISHLVEEERIDYQSWRERGKEMRLNTELASVAAHGHTSKAAKLWGVSESTIRYRVSQHTEWGLGDVYGADPQL